MSHFQQGLGLIRSAGIGGAILLSPLIWASESLAIWGILRALGVSLDSAPVLILTGVASLGTLVPSAPGYLGTLQYAFHLTLTSVGQDGAVAVVAASAFQVFLFGGLTMAAMMMWLEDTRRDKHHASA